MVCPFIDALEFTILLHLGHDGKGTLVSLTNGKLTRVRYRSHATHSRQPRQVRKEATVTSSGVCSGFPVPGFFLSARPCIRLCLLLHEHPFQLPRHSRASTARE